MLTHLFDNIPSAVALLAVLLFFVASVLIGIVESYRPKTVVTTNFNSIATVVAGMVLTVASGVLGTAPAVTSPGPSTTAASAQALGAAVTIASAQVEAFKNLYTVTYIVAGFCCLMVLLLPTKKNHELVKTVGFTTLAFLSLFVTNNLGATHGGVANLNVAIAAPPSQDWAPLPTQP